MKTLCIYHANCLDGFAAAWVVRKAWQEEKITDPLGHVYGIDYFGGVYNKEPDWQLVKDRHVIIVDFSYSPSVMEKMQSVAAKITWIDHHKSAIEAMKDFPWRRQDSFFVSLDHSGAMLTWQYFFPQQIDNPPKLLAHIEDRDLWRFKLHATREINFAMFSHPYAFRLWDMLMDPVMIPELIRDGTPIYRKHMKDVEELLELTTRYMVIGGRAVPVANISHLMASDAAEQLCLKTSSPFAACYYDKPGGRVFSLRSTPDGADVSEIAKQYGGGGHKHASGFTVPVTHPLASS